MNAKKCILVLLIVLMVACTHKRDNQPENTLQYVDVGTDRIAYKISGKGFPLLMCMGYSGTMELWQADVISKLSIHFKVILFDYPGMGYSTTQDTAFTIKGLAENAYDFLNKLNINKAHLMGWSMGTNVAQELALNHPDIIEKVVLYAGDCGDTVAVKPPDWVVNIMIADNPSPWEMLSTLFPQAWLEAHPNPADYFPKIIKPADSSIVAMQWAAFEKWNEPGGGTAGRLNSFTQAVLLITGDEDVSTPTANSYILLDSIPNASLVLLPECGHGAMYQVPENFADSVLAFLRSTGS